MRSNKAGLAELALLLKKAQSESVLAEQTSRVPSERPQTRCHRPEEETGLFFLALRNVTPLQAPARAQRDRPLAACQGALHRATYTEKEPLRSDAGIGDSEEINHLLCASATTFVRSGMAPNTARQLQRGQWQVSAEIDLHGLGIEQARQTVLSFLSDCEKRGLRCIRIVHGKGYGSPGLKPILKNKVRAWLIQTPQVQAFAQAQANAGGSGALLALLKTKPKGNT